MDLVAVWFVAIAALWLGFLLLEGFDFGDALLFPRARSNPRRPHLALMLRTIGPISYWNEVWLVTAIEATFAAFPPWYASWLSTSYLLFVLLVAALIGRAVAFEWRHARHNGALGAWLDPRHHDEDPSSAGIAAGAATGGTTLGLPHRRGRDPRRRTHSPGQPGAPPRGRPP